MIRVCERWLPELFAIIAFTAGVFAAPIARANSADRDLLKAVPPDAGLTIALTDLRNHSAELLDSKIAHAFFALPAVKDWFESERGRALARARADIETNLGTSLKAIRDDLIGDAVVLSLHFDVAKGTQPARGLALTHVRNQELLEKLLGILNKSDAMLERVEDVGSEAAAYKVRRFKPNSGREPEYYRLFADGTFAWSNSETLIKAVIDRKNGGSLPSMAENADYSAVRSGLPARSLVTLILSRKLTSLVLTQATQTDDAKQAKLAKSAAGYLQAVEAVGLSLEWRDGVVLHAHQVIEPKKLDAGILRWARSNVAPDSLTKRVPATAFAVAAMAVDCEAILQGITAFTSEAERPRLDVALDALQGILLGRNLQKEVLPWLGPGLMAYVEEPGTTWPHFPFVAVLQLREDQHEPSIAKALDNAIRTVISLYALDAKRPAARFRLVSSQQGKTRITSFVEPGIPFAYALGPDFLALGTSADAVSRFGNEGTTPDARLAPFRAAHFPDAQAFAAIDLTRLVRIATDHRDKLVERSGKPRDVDRAIALLNLFKGAFLAVRVDPELKYLHQSVGLIAR